MFLLNGGYQTLGFLVTHKEAHTQALWALFRTLQMKVQRSLGRFVMQIPLPSLPPSFLRLTRLSGCVNGQSASKKLEENSQESEWKGRYQFWSHELLRAKRKWIEGVTLYVYNK